MVKGYFTCVSVTATGTFGNSYHIHFNTIYNVSLGINFEFFFSLAGPGAATNVVTRAAASFLLRLSLVSRWCPL